VEFPAAQYLGADRRSSGTTMQRPHVHLALPDGSIRELEHGDLIGRL
jgi:hypothetical protein